MSQPPMSQLPMNQPPLGTLPTMERIPSGVPGLDTVLGGGFTRGGIHILQGMPGAGKTTLGNQVCFRHAQAGGRALYVTLLAESHGRMLLHLGTMRFFDSDRLLDQITYISAIAALEEDGLGELLALLRREVAAHKATIMILDGLVAAQDRAASDTEFKRFIQDLQAQAALYDCTVFLLTTAKGAISPAEHTMVDGVIELGDAARSGFSERSLLVRKLRGSDFLRGRHQFRITEGGLVVYPRIEAVFHHPSRVLGPTLSRLSCGIPELDTALGGGLLEASVTGVFGPSGCGKTTLGLHFLAQASPDEPALLFGCFESPERLVQQGDALGLGIGDAVARGDLEIIWEPQGENLPDTLAHRMLDAIARRGVRRLLIDGLTGFIESIGDEDRIGRFFSVLNNELRARGVTTLGSIEVRDIVTSRIHLPIDGVSALLENMIALRFVERDAALRRVLTIVKVRGSAFDPSVREFAIAHGSGISLFPAHVDVRDHAPEHG